MGAGVQAQWRRKTPPVSAACADDGTERAAFGRSGYPYAFCFGGLSGQLCRAVIAVSHDRYFLDRFAQKIFALEQDGSIKPYIGGYSDYAEALQEESAQQAQPVKAKPVAAAKPAEEPAKKKMTYGERLELERLDQEIARSEAELKMLGAEINQCGSDFTRLADLTKQQEAVQQKLDEMVDRWAYLSELAEAEG